MVSLAEVSKQKLLSLEKRWLLYCSNSVKRHQLCKVLGLSSKCWCCYCGQKGMPLGSKRIYWWEEPCIRHRHGLQLLRWKSHLRTKTVFCWCSYPLTAWSRMWFGFPPLNFWNFKLSRFWHFFPHYSEMRETYQKGQKWDHWPCNQSLGEESPHWCSWYKSSSLCRM